MLYDQETNLMREVYYENPDLKYAYKQNDYDQLGRFYKEQLIVQKGDSTFGSHAFIISEYQQNRLEKKFIYHIEELRAQDTVLSSYEIYDYNEQGQMIEGYWEAAEGVVSTGDPCI